MNPYKSNKLLNLNEGTAAIRVRVVKSEGDKYLFSIKDCHKEITLTNLLNTEEERQNGLYKLRTIVEEANKLIKHILKEEQ